MKLVTVWKRFDDKTRTFEHNHIEDGHVPGHVPTIKHEAQRRAWERSLWVRLHRYLDSAGRVVEDCARPGGREPSDSPEGGGDRAARPGRAQIES